MALSGRKPLKEWRLWSFTARVFWQRSSAGGTFRKPSQKNRHVFINLASGTLKAMIGPRVMMALPLIMGRPKQPTPQFDSAIVNIIFHPSWTVPPAMAADIMARAQTDPGYLQTRGL